MLRLNQTEFIVHQTNCRTAGARGLAKLIFQKYPHSNTYRSGTRRIPGTISVHHPIINLYGQDGPGKAGPHSIEGKHRLSWFQQGLAEIDILMMTVIAPAHDQGRGSAHDAIDLYNDDNTECTSKVPRVHENADVSTSSAVKSINEDCNGQRSDSIGTLYFPYQIGCGLAGGDWNTYRSVLKEWSEGKPYSVHIVRLD
jgi:hypothetical protein